MDPLSDVLALLGAHSHRSAKLTAGGDWSIRLASAAAYHGVKFNAVIRGSCWLSVVGDESGPVRLEAGEGFLFSGGHSYILGSDPSLAPVDAKEVFASARDGHASLGSVADVVVIGGHVTLDEADAAILTGALPPIFRLPAGSPEARTIAWLVERLGEEGKDERPGSALVSDHLIHLLFVELLRAYLQRPESERPRSGWLGALADPRIGRTLQRLHAEPARRWTLAELASVAQIALSLGYESESAFSNAFKRVVGVAPLHHRQSLAGG